ncbi:MAG: phosphonate transport permease protein PhnE [Verrucomicrobiota bacterium]
MKPPRLDAPRVAVLLFFLAVLFSLPVLQPAGRELDYAANLTRFLSRFWPPDFSILPTIFPALVETFQIAVLGTVLACLAGIPIAAAASKNIAPRWLVAVVRLLLNAIRSIPGLIWALIAVAILGANAGAGVAALAIYSLGYLGKFFSDAFESADPAVNQALRAGGASRIQAFQYGIWPHAAPLAWSHTLWMLEYNIRSASIVGYVGAGGIGVWLHTYQEFYQWDKFAAVLACILVAVILLDIGGSCLRRTLAPTAP